MTDHHGAVERLHSECRSDELKAVLRPTNRARGLPNSAYTEAAFHRLELARTFWAGWFCLGPASRVPMAGDVLPVDFAGVPLLVLRDRSGLLRVFHNVCRHRGLRLVNKAGRCRNVLRCPYHSWAYGLDGRLKATPHFSGVGQHDHPGLDPLAHGLLPVRSAIWCDLVFVNLDGQAPDFNDFIAPLGTRWAAFDLTQLCHGGTFELLVTANWKLIVENYCESYHLPWVHPGLNAYSRLGDHYHIIGAGYAGQGSNVYDPPRDGKPLPCFDSLDRDTARRAEYIALFPNVLLGIHADHFFAIWLQPLDPLHTREHFEIYFVGREALTPARARRRRQMLAAWREILLEDVSPVEGMQRGRASPEFDGGLFSPAMDAPTHHFHCWVAERLLAEAADGRPV